ncbi:hypothetical protein DERF_001556 [Dermatophagoides farinae]|uniref:Uncharacterized protein n=1 Tax=Dermatophagoides farinae TaxID=6954 RepID=A0A922LBA3_DERFA|nr:hypothetical protein DERF_001556 [Dermatophagoides farinae]
MKKVFFALSLENQYDDILIECLIDVLIVHNSYQKKKYKSPVLGRWVQNLWLKSGTAHFILLLLSLVKQSHSFCTSSCEPELHISNAGLWFYAC